MRYAPPPGTIVVCLDCPKSLKINASVLGAAAGFASFNKVTIDIRRDLDVRMTHLHVDVLDVLPLLDPSGTGFRDSPDQAEMLPLLLPGQDAERPGVGG